MSTGPESPAAFADELPLLGEVLPVELTNSHYVGDGADIDFLGEAASASAWFGAASAAGHLAPPDRWHPATLGAVRAVRDAMRAVLASVADGDGLVDVSSPPWLSAAETLHGAVQRASSHVALDLSGPVPTWRVHHRDSADGRVLLAAIATECTLFLGGEDVGHVRRCERPACPMLFVRRHRARRFCSEACAHSVRQARYYRRSRDRARRLRALDD